MLHHASESVVESMKAVIANHGAGTTKRELVEALRREETNRGLVFDYCLITMGTSLNRASSEQAWGKGDILSLDSGANYQGYIGDLCRMAILGEPDAELDELLCEIETIQRAAMKPIKAGAMGSSIYTAAEPLVRQSAHHNHMEFLAHGMGLVAHEAPRLPACRAALERNLRNRDGHAVLTDVTAVLVLVAVVNHKLDSEHVPGQGG